MFNFGHNDAPATGEIATPTVADKMFVNSCHLGNKIPSDEVAV